MFVFPDAFVFFGILHMIAAGSLLATPLLRAPALVPLLLGVAVLVLSQVVASPVFDLPALWWVGLGTTVPVTNDYVPIFPWFGPMLIGVAVGRLVATGAVGLPALKAEGGPARWLAVAGRWTLPIYLLHQPILFSAVAGIALLLPVNPAAEQARFRRGMHRRMQPLRPGHGLLHAVLRLRRRRGGRDAALQRPGRRGRSGDPEPRGDGGHHLPHGRGLRHRAEGAPDTGRPDDAGRLGNAGRFGDAAGRRRSAPPSDRGGGGIGGRPAPADGPARAGRAKRNGRPDGRGGRFSIDTGAERGWRCVPGCAVSAGRVWRGCAAGSGGCMFRRRAVSDTLRSQSSYTRWMCSPPHAVRGHRVLGRFGPRFRIAGQSGEHLVGVGGLGQVVDGPIFTAVTPSRCCRSR